MGSPLVPLLAGIFITDFENKLLPKKHSYKMLWMRYVCKFEALKLKVLKINKPQVRTTTRTINFCAQLISAAVPLTEDSEVQLCTVEGTATSPGMLCRLSH